MRESKRSVRTSGVTESVAPSSVLSDSEETIRPATDYSAMVFYRTQAGKELENLQQRQEQVEQKLLLANLAQPVIDQH